MDNLLIFAYESGICMAALYCIYWIFLKRETYFTFNRVYLLAAILFSCLIPLVNFSPPANFNITMSWQLIILVIYLLGVVTILGRIVLGIVKISRLRLGGSRINSETYSMVFSRKNLAPFSFFSTVFMNESLLNSFQKNFVLKHEQTHIRQGHTYDNIFVEVCLALFWFNPFMWFIRKSLRHTHEYLADEGVRKTEADLSKYQLILIQQGKGFSPLCVSNDFNLMIKRRIKIMCRSRSGLLAKLKPLFIIPVALCLTLLFVCSNMVDHLLMDHLKAGLDENVIKIDDQRDKLTECVNFLKLRPAQNHDVVAERVRLADGREGYFLNFSITNSATLEPAVFGYMTDEDFDILRYQWRGDTALVKFENSRTKAHMDFEWKPSGSSSSLLRIDTPE